MTRKTLKKLLRENQVELWTPYTRHEIETADGGFQVSLLGILAQRETRKMAERITRGMHKRAEQGEWMGGVPPYGYMTRRTFIDSLLKQGLSETEAFALASSKTPKDKALYINEPEAEMVRTIFNLYINEDFSLAQVQSHLNTRYRARNGGLFRRAQICSILNHPVYAGFIRWNKRSNSKDKLNNREDWLITKGVHEPILSEALWDQAQVKRGNNKRGKRRPNSPFFLTGVLFCGQCNSRMNGVSNSNPWQGYKCLGNNMFGKEYCSFGSISKRKLEAAVLADVEEILLDPKIIQETLVELEDRLSHSSDEFSQEIKKRENGLNSLSQKLNRWYEAFEDGSIDPKQFAERVSTLEAQKEVLEAERQDLQQKIQAEKPKVDLESVKAFLSEMNKEMDHSDKKDLLRALGAKVTVLNKKQAKIEYDLCGVFGGDGEKVAGCSSRWTGTNTTT
ncbi:MAG: hypothetical protein GKR89_26175 [Candidatus Latescibacteria bacterium]|nr:hypothetical protein [Candidatus Latescibacterota bacterium]